MTRIPDLPKITFEPGKTYLCRNGIDFARVERIELYGSNRKPLICTFFTHSQVKPFKKYVIRFEFDGRFYMGRDNWIDLTETLYTGP